jgi:DNA-binding transcriptional ArsR family regulator
MGAYISQPSVVLPKFLLADRNLSNHAKSLLALLDDYRNKKTGQCNPRIDRLASDLSLSRRTIERALSELARWGLVIIRHGQRVSQYAVAARELWEKLLAQARIKFSKIVEKRADQDPPPERTESEENTGVLPDPVATNCRSALRQIVAVEPPLSLLNLPSEPTYPANEGIDAARSVHHVETTQAAAAPPALVDNGRSRTRSPLSEALWKELVSVHPQPGKPIAALEEIDRLLFDNRGQAQKLVEVLRRRHAEWREYWATLDRAGYIPQLWRWVKECEWIAAPVIRKPALREYATAGERINAAFERLAEKDRLRGRQ